MAHEWQHVAGVIGFVHHDAGPIEEEPGHDVCMKCGAWRYGTRDGHEYLSPYKVYGGELLDTTFCVPNCRPSKIASNTV